MKSIRFKKFSVCKIYFLTIKELYNKAYEENLKDLPLIYKVTISFWFFLNVIFFSPKLFFKIWKDRKEINRLLKIKYKVSIMKLFLNMGELFPELSEENANFLTNGISYGFLSLYLDKIFPKFQIVSEKLTENGWFINNYIKINIEGDPDSLIYSDNFNMEILKNNIKEIEDLAIKRFPDRIEYLKLGFRHHKCKDYISSISILLPQIDGIFRELTNKELFSKATNKNPSSWLNGIEESEKEGLIHFLLSPLKRKEYFGANFSEALENPQFLSRNRILHGEDMELNNELKNFKVISLLLYIVSVVYDAVYEDVENPRLKDYYSKLAELQSLI